MSDKVIGKVSQQLGEGAKQVLKDTGHQIANIPQEAARDAGRHVVGLESPLSYQTEKNMTSVGDVEANVTPEEVEERDKKRLVELRKRLNEIKTQMSQARTERTRRETQREREMEKESQVEEKKHAETKRKRELTAQDKKIQSRQGTREIGRRPTG